MLNQRFIRLLPNALNVMLEENITHRCITRNHDFINLLADEVVAFAHVHDFAVECGNQRASEFSLKFTVVGDAVHDVATAETLRVFKGTHRDRFPIL